MKLKKNLLLGIAIFASFLLCASLSFAQQKPTAIAQANVAYDVTQESVVQGTVLSYTAASSVAPIGPQAKIQTSSGVVDVHLGNASLMKQYDMFLAPGDSVKIVGESFRFSTGPVVLARIVQKGNQTAILRNLHGIPLLGKPRPDAKPRVLAGEAR